MTTPTHNAQFPPLQASRTSAAPEPSAAGSSWERQPSEPALWHDRFITYRDLGPTRTIDAAYRHIAARDNLTAPRPGSAWYRNATRWQWTDRAAAWDSAQRQQIRKQETDRRFDARELRLHMIDEMLDGVFQVLQQCRLHELTPDLARAWLPTMRLMFKDLLSAQRSELGLPPVAQGTHDEDSLFFSAEELIKAHAQLEAWRRQQQPSNHTDLRNCLAELYADEASARRLADQAGLDLSHIAFGRLALNNWHAVLVEAEHAGLLQRLIAICHAEYPNQPILRKHLQENTP